MSIEASIPKIDDRRYEDIVTEARTRISRYTPEWTPVWTDLNDSDPGITLVQVFAWLSEMLIYRMSLTPELNYLKFLQLLGIELRPAESASVEITLPILDSFSEPSVFVPERTQIAADAPDGGPPIVFETERGLTALKAPLASVQVFDSFAYTDVTAANEEPGEGLQPFGTLAQLNSALLLGFDYSDDFPQIELSLMFWLFEDAETPAYSTCGLESAFYPSAEIVWEYWTGTKWKQLSVLKDATRSLMQSGILYLKTPAPGLMQRATMGSSATDLYWIRGRLSRSEYENVPRLYAIRTNTVSAIQAITYADEVLGGSSGRPNQVFRVTNIPVLAGTLHLEVDEGSGFTEWTEVSDFFASAFNDIHYVLNRTTGEIRFGDGVHGAIPVANISNPNGNIVARDYRSGGGASGNVAAGALKTLLTPVKGIDENGISNLRDAYGAREEESLADAKLRAPQELKSKCRAVTSEDFEHLAMEATAIKRAKALPLYHPGFPGTQVPGVVSVIVVPDSPDPKPMPSEGTLKTVCAYLDQRRLLTTEVFVLRPTYRQVVVSVEVTANNNADLGEVKTQIEEELLNYFHPLKGGEDGTGWPFGGTVYFSLVYRRVLQVEGVGRITSLVINVECAEAQPCTDIEIPEGVLLYSTEHEIQVGYSFE